MKTRPASKRNALRTLLASCCAVLAAVSATPTRADPDTITIHKPLNLRFGNFAVPTSGYREVTAAGTITGSGIVSLDDSGVGPARFTVEFARGDSSTRNLNLTIEMVFSSPTTFRQTGMTATLSRYQSDLPGYGLIQPGQVVRITIANCRTRTCSKSFSLGGRLDVDRRFGGGPVSIPIPIDAVVVAIN